MERHTVRAVLTPKGEAYLRGYADGRAGLEMRVLEEPPAARDGYLAGYVDARLTVDAEAPPAA